MYSVYLSNKVNGNYERDLIFTDKYSSDITAMIDPTLSIESGTAGSFDFTLPVTNCGYNKINPMTTEVIVVKNDEEVWRGRVLNPECDFFNQMKVETEGELTYLNDTFQPQHEYKTDTLRQVIEGILSIHNKKVGTYDSETETWTPNANEPIDKIFYVGAVFVSEDDPTGTDRSYRATDYDTTLNCLKKIADTYKGYFIVRRDENGKRYLDFVKEFTEICQQRIDFGINLLDYSKSFKMEDLCTVAMPIGGKVQDTDFTEADEMYIYRTEYNPSTQQDEPVNFLDRDGNLGRDPNADDREAGVVYINEYGLHENDKIYVSCTQYKDETGYEGRYKDGIWAFATENGTVIAGTNKSYSSSSGVETYSKNALTIPAGAQRLRVASTTFESPHLKVYKQKAESQLDEHFTIAPYANVDDENFKHIPGDVYLIYKPLYEKYGWHEKKLEFGNLEKSEDLWNMATYWLTHTQFEQMVLNITALDLSDMNQPYDDIWINMKVPIYSKPHGLTDNLLLPCTKMTIKLNNPENTQYTLGYTTPSKISDTQSNVNTDISKMLEEVPTYSSTFKSIQENATQIIESMAGVGAVTFLHETPGHPEQISAIVISNNPDPDLASQQWKWDMGGFGYREKDSQTGVWGDYTTAITMTGTIVGQFIAAGTIYGDRIRGGTLTLGNVGLPVADDGKIEVLSSSNYRVAALEKDWGMTVETDDNDTTDGYLVRVRNGVIYGGYKHAEGSTNSKNGITDDDVGEQCTGRIRFNNGYITGGQTKYGVDIRGNILGIVTDGIWLRKTIYLGPGADDPSSGNYNPLYVGLDDKWVTCGNEDVHFIHGIAVETRSNVNNGGE